MMKLLRRKELVEPPARYLKIVHHRAGVDPDRRFDKTQLKEAGYADKVHRDYAAHYFRWGWAGNFVGRETRVLEVGCGQDTPLARVLSGNMSTVPKSYLGVDLNKLPKPLKTGWAKYLEETSFIDAVEPIRRNQGPFDLVVSFEVIEHMGRADGKALLEGMRKVLDVDGRILLSTPVYNGKHMAANHIHEYEFEELKELIEECGLEVVRVHGTFMRSDRLKKCCTPEEWKLVEQLHEFHSWDVMSTFLASKYPEHSSNCAWVLRSKAPF